GTEIVTVARSGDGWLISATGHQGPPFDVQTNKFELTYADDWQPRHLEIQALLRGQPVSMTTTIAETTATNQVTSAARTTSFKQNVSAKTVLLPNSFYASYEALAARLSTMAAGDRLPLYVTPDGEIVATVAKVTPRLITTPSSRATY